jgi:hypothetical protein
MYAKCNIVREFKTKALLEIKKTIYSYFTCIPRHKPTEKTNSLLAH